MTLGEKIQQLRKIKGMSQEQLATQITVSRQAISKWELCESMPDTDNILQLSKIFEVSTDYLLKDEMNNIQNVSSNETNQESLPRQHYTSMIFKICIGLELIALLMALMFLLFWDPLSENINLVLSQNGKKVGICLIVQVIAVFLFEVICNKYCYEKMSTQIRRYFYSISVWILMPLPMLYMAYYVYPIIRRPITFWTDLLYLFIPYIIFCVIVNLCIVIKKSKSK